jgi:hypothetical protein
MADFLLHRFCPPELGYYIKRVECVAVDGMIPSYSTGDNMVCDKDLGSICMNSDNFPVQCQDYMIRYVCHQTCVSK